MPAMVGTPAEAQQSRWYAAGSVQSQGGSAAASEGWPLAAHHTHHPRILSCRSLQRFALTSYGCSFSFSTANW
ncbi:hypothetical protein F751_3911 [Auxenochlorella protothecoides]|uniref:Uncharacterized protein n=1 Tax=Auxenochlorella protothecoides TaxID=3075 RepID=A0A087SD91_AUXPR|nr:hypothetical protein F751_3911 [Auxenochlorella protothecoides]KFM23695.1 hypothetical protein F751_3911 [Auxenochlorella protothecoides]